MDDRKVLAAAFFVTDADTRMPACIVAVGTYFGDEIGLWSAYGGGYPAGLSRDQGAAIVARNGDKLSRTRAHAMFPELATIAYCD